MQSTWHGVHACGHMDTHAGARVQSKGKAHGGAKDASSNGPELHPQQEERDARARKRSKRMSHGSNSSREASPTPVPPLQPPLPLAQPCQRHPWAQKPDMGAEGAAVPFQDLNHLGPSDSCTQVRPWPACACMGRRFRVCSGGHGTTHVATHITGHDVGPVAVGGLR